MNQVKTIVCSYYLSPEEILKKMKLLGRKNNLEFTGVIVNNNEKNITKEEDLSSWIVIKGSNYNLDFSAYAEGIKHLMKKENLTSALFINDSIFIKHHANFNIKLLLKNADFIDEVGVPAISGKQDNYKTICLSNPWGYINSYISSYCFILNSMAIDILLQLDNFAQEDGLYETVHPQNKNFAHSLPPNFREFLLANTFYQHSVFSWRKLNSFNSEIQNRKLRCIYFEHRLSGEIAKKGIIVPSNMYKKDKIILDILDRFTGKFKKLFSI